jgi:diguanylate cyclase (GGDEF)-like protein
MYDITAAKQYQAELEYKSNYDALTGLANRNLLHDRVERAIAHAERQGQKVWIVHVNLDRFKFINDTLGYTAGDDVLRTVGQRLQEAALPTDTVARTGADEFVLMLPGTADEHTVTTRVQGIMNAIGQPLAIAGHGYFLTCTIGVAGYPSDGGDAETLIRHADIAMHRAREIGRNIFRFYTVSMNERAMDRLRLEADLRHALQRDELLLYYQPQVDVRTGRVVGMEALLRWQHPQLGLVPPDRFIRVAEETGLIVPIGTWVMRTACMQAKKWQDAGLGSLQVGVNLSGNQFYQKDIVQVVESALSDSGLPANCFDIELTEGLVMTDVDQALGIMHGLKRLGVSLSIDDFGTGYSSLAYLKRFPIDVLKIDKSFVRNITTEPDEAAIARSIITLAQSLRLQVIAEGVETEQQLCYLRRHRCDQIQGYYFSRPLPAPDFERLLAEDKSLPHADGGEELRQTLLLVDDEESMTAALTRLLRRDGYRILRAHSAEEGLSLLALHDIQVVLSDHRMPGMTGTEFLAKVKDLHPKAIRIMLSGYTAVDAVIDATNSGAVFRFHTKPWDDNVLRASIAEAFRYHWMMQGGESVTPGAS